METQEKDKEREAEFDECETEYAGWAHYHVDDAVGFARLFRRQRDEALREVEGWRMLARGECPERMTGEQFAFMQRVEVSPETRALIADAMIVADDGVPMPSLARRCREWLDANALSPGRTDTNREKGDG